MKKLRVTFRSAFALLILPAFLSCNDQNVKHKATQDARKTENAMAYEKSPEPASGNQHEGSFTIKSRWELPESLAEISGIALYKGLLACVQDEEGKIYLFNPATGKVEWEHAFAGTGDYEGIAIVDNTAWVLRADGQLFEVRNFDSAKPDTREHQTPLSAKQDTEGLFADLPNKRLLIAVKGKDPDSKDYKGVYAYDLTAGKLLPEPVYRIAISSGEAGGKKKKKSKKATNIQPSEIALHPAGGDLYVLDGPGAALFVLNKEGTEKQHYTLEKVDFPQPEGLAFTDNGELYISTEGRGDKGTILRVAFGK